MTALDRAAVWPWLGAAAATLLGYRLFRTLPRMRLRNRTVLVTGGTRGLGFALAREILRQGARVALCARDDDEVRAAVRALAGGGTVLGHACDVTDPDAVHDLVTLVRDRLGPVDAVVNNAGQMLVGPLESMTRADFEAAMDVHFRGPLNVILELLPSMRARRLGRIVNIASIGGLVPIPHMAPYVASKFALVGLSRALRVELARSRIRVTTVSPGPLRTGSPFGVRFKGRHDDEFAWFTLADALPLVSTAAARAARRIVTALRSGEPEVTLGVPTRVLRAIDALAPGLTESGLGLVERFVLPDPGGIGEESATGAESTARLRDSWPLRRTARAARELQEHEEE